METIKEGKITLLDHNGNRVGETFIRRAKQLVKQQRAMWANESHTAIRFSEGETQMHEDDLDEIESTRDDAAVIELARIRLSSRRRFFWNTVLLLPGYLLAFIVANMMWFRPNTSTGFFLGVAFTLWTVFYVYNAVRFFKLNRGMHTFPFSLLENRYNRKLKAEIELIKRMST
jgi:hypothetical protein